MLKSCTHMSYAKTRNRMWKQNPHCHWCGILTLSPLPGKESVTYSDTATLDHLYSKWELRENPDLLSQQTTVIACAKCNADRGRKAERDWLSKYRAETAQICNPRLVKVGEILAAALTG